MSELGYYGIRSNLIIVGVVIEIRHEVLIQISQIRTELHLATRPALVLACRHALVI